MFVVTVAARKHIPRELVLKTAIYRQTTAVAATVPVAHVPSRKSTWILCPSRTRMKPPPPRLRATISADLEL
jgi:hypothetical protein